MKNNLTNKPTKPTNAVKPLLSSRGFALIATISILSLIALISLALLSLATTKTKVSSYSNHLNIARDNARLALEIAIGQLQKYTGPDQRVTARADITDRDWTDVTPQVANPYYHLAWDVSGSEIDYTANLKGYNNNHFKGWRENPAAVSRSGRVLGSFGVAGGVLEADDFGLDLGQSDYHRPGMDPGHNFDKKPAVLVSGNEFYDLTDNVTGEYIVGDYPSSDYVDQYTDLEAAEIARIEIIPSSSIMIPGSLDTGDVNEDIKVEVPIVKMEGSTEGSSYAYWIGDESLKSRINLEVDFKEVAESASRVSQRAPLLESFQQKVADNEVSSADVKKRLTMSSLELNDLDTEKKGFNYSPDITTTSESMVIDVRNGGFKKDFTYALYNYDIISPRELWDNSIPLDVVRRPEDGKLQHWTQTWSPMQGLLPLVEKWRNLALDPINVSNTGVADSIDHWTDERGLYPVMSQVQMLQHVAYKVDAIEVIDPLTSAPKLEGTFEVYMGVYPSVTLWNPYNVPMKLSRDFTLSLVRRELTLDQSRNKVRTHYSLLKPGGDPDRSSDINEFAVIWPEGVFRGRPVGHQEWSGWTMSATLRMPKGTAVSSKPDVEIPAGETMVFSPSTITREDIAMNKLSSHKNVHVVMEEGWNVGQGVLMKMDERVHSLEDYGGSLPKARLVQPTIKDNLAWVLNGEGRPGSRYLFNNANTRRVSGKGFLAYPIQCSLWPRLDAVAQSTSSFVTPPEVTNLRQDTSGSFPNLLVKHSLRMGDDYLTTPEGAIKEGQTELSFPYAAYYNLAALLQAGFADSNAPGQKTGEALAISPTLMGGVYDFQGATEIYPVSTKLTGRASATPIGIGYLNGERLIMTNRILKPDSDAVKKNGASASITSFSQLNGSQFLKGRRQDLSIGTSSLLGSLTSSNIPAFPIGNSLANPKLDIHHDEKGRSSADTPYFDRTVNFGGIGKMYNSPNAGNEFDAFGLELDYSYVLNDHLYDHYFFSTIPQAPGDYKEDLPLVNSRLVPSEEAKQDYKDDTLIAVPKTRRSVANDVGISQAPTVPLTQKERENYTNKLKNINSAQYLTLVGGFNVNSTSVPAWEMLLSSSLGSERDGISQSASEKTVSFSNKETATGGKSPTSTDEDDVLDSNFHMTLTQPQIRELAEAMVSEVKRRGPFPSLSAFVNRANFLRDMARPNPNEIRSLQDEDRGDTNGTVSSGFDGKNPRGLTSAERENLGIVDARYSGAIQSALDRIKANKKLDESRTINEEGFVEKIPEGWVYPAREAFRKSVNSHLPGYLKQSDVLAQIAPVVTVRGDTFTIRCFGASGEGPDGQPIAKVVCEAVVQRGKEFVDPSGNTYDTPVRTVQTGVLATSSTLTETNQRFGRKYKIVSFKWLSQIEVAKMKLSDL